VENEVRPVTKIGIGRVVLLDAVVLTVSEGDVVRDERAFSNTGCSTWSDYASRTQSRGRLDVGQGATIGLLGR